MEEEALVEGEVLVEEDRFSTLTLRITFFLIRSITSNSELKPQMNLGKILLNFY